MFTFIDDILTSGVIGLIYGFLGGFAISSYHVPFDTYRGVLTLDFEIGATSSSSLLSYAIKFMIPNETFSADEVLNSAPR